MQDVTIIKQPTQTGSYSHSDLLLLSKLVAIHNINNKTASKNLIKNLIKLINFVEEKDLQIHANHIPGIANSVTDY